MDNDSKDNIRVDNDSDSKGDVRVNKAAKIMSEWIMTATMSKWIMTVMQNG